ncbi:hypothetical protein ELQ35_12555 [Peribacillus cavernae]|uniref:Uncharacterized protein n=1 Tax=Peribacillus cavernae TaxID=1674310 RepID=A0A3S0VI23_9BACI|nr:hypothetical protein [Peribacillus cavernae]MDQ0218308.1 hypothetical protein [Peribacillus cavernae]RUQ28410.1 hypothetical protein ELQ35_12555 [Peribacillus cavernae]
MISLSAYQPKLKQETSRKSLKAGIWLDGTFDWVTDESASYANGEVRTLIQSFTKRQVTFFKFTIKNSSKEKLIPKIMFHYENLLERQTVAFYSPGEKAIMHIGQTSVALIGGLMNGKGISQYCIQGKKHLYQNGCFKSLKEGILAFSPLAKGEVSSMFSFETAILPQDSAEAIAWVISSATQEEAKFINDSLLAAGPNLNI